MFVGFTIGGYLLWQLMTTGQEILATPDGIVISHEPITQPQAISQPQAAPQQRGVAAPSLMNSELYDVEGVRESHAVAKPSNCQKIAQRFAREGRNIRFVRVVGNPNFNPGSLLPYICIFEGPDAQEGYYTTYPNSHWD